MIIRLIEGISSKSSHLVYTDAARHPVGCILLWNLYYLFYSGSPGENSLYSRSHSFPCARSVSVAGSRNVPKSYTSHSPSISSYRVVPWIYRRLYNNLIYIFCQKCEWRELINITVKEKNKKCLGLAGFKPRTARRKVLSACSTRTI